MTYNYTPAISFPEFEDLTLPSSETLWNLPVVDDETWRESYASSIIITAREAHGNLFNSQATRYSAFATRIMIAAISLEVWNHQRQYESLQDVLTEFRLRQAVEAWVASLAFCEPETIIVQLDAPHKGHPLIFNSMAVYRNLLARLEVDLKTTQEALRYHNPYEVANQMIKARDLVGRSAAMTQVIGQCYECLEIVVLEGLKSPDQSCATNWSIEHPLCSFDLIAILTLWLYRYESEGLYRLDADTADANHRERADAERDETSAELAVYTKLQNLLEDCTSPQSLRLSSVVARIWADMLNDVTVWGYVISLYASALYYTLCKLFQSTFRATRISISSRHPHARLPSCLARFGAPANCATALPKPWELPSCYMPRLCRAIWTLMATIRNIPA